MDSSPAPDPVPPADLVEVAPPPRGPWSFWATLGFGLLAMGVMVAAQAIVGIVFAVTTMAQQYGRHGRNAIDPDRIAQELASNPLMLAIAMFVSLPAVGLALWLMIHLRRGPGLLDYLGLRGFRVSQFIFWAVVLTGVVYGGEWFLKRAGDRSGQQFMADLLAQGSHLPMLITAVVLGAPLLEEFLFRGFMYRGMAVRRHSVWLAILIPNLLWTLLHVQYQPATMAVLFCMGLVFGCARHFSGSTMLAVLLHALSNALGTISTMVELQEKVAAP
ncbi:MAG: family intrarane metalloprotease [Chthoniobacter sp.]|jgi:hypothetical protein|nr:family intrarane metalloprotease [Chthoniobacter sp.]